MSRARREVYREFEALRRQVNGLMESLFVKEPMTLMEDSWIRAYDLIEDQDGIMVQVELPGIDEEALSLTWGGQNLSIQGERRAQYDADDKQIHRRRIVRYFRAHHQYSCLVDT